MKRRPGWHQKATCIRSVVAAADRLRTEGGHVRLIGLVDTTGGPLTSDIATALGRFDTVTQIRGGSARRSWKAMLDVLGRDLAHEILDVVYLVEDDHLHTADALLALESFQGEFGLLYCKYYAEGGDTRHVCGFEWRDALTGVSSFAMSREAYLRSRRLLRAMSNANHAWDDLTWRTLRGPAQFNASYLAWPFLSSSPWPPWRPEAMWQAMWRVIGFVWSLCRRPSTLTAVYPSRATHVESGELSEGQDWAALAESLGRRSG